MPAGKEALNLTYQLKITIQGIRPPVWRRVRAPGWITLRQLHGVIQIVFGWTESHLHQFEIGATLYGEPDAFAELGNLDENRISLLEAVGERTKRFLYVYDFGDDWRHEVVIEKVEPAGPAEHRPVCVAGKRQGPPDDCGGPWGYEEFLQAIQDPNHEQHEDMLEWIGGGFDPEEFDLGMVNRSLAAAAVGGRKGRFR